MELFGLRTRNDVDVDQKRPVFFVCHPDDFELHFERICQDIFKTQDCAVYYCKDQRTCLPREVMELELSRSNLLVVAVTRKLLETHSWAVETYIPFALEQGISVLPICMEPHLDKLYSESALFGPLQFLNPYSEDTTEIAYEEKLRKRLQELLVSAPLMGRIRDAFPARIFLSYRKKDRSYANALMRWIHRHPGCRDIAVWFDEFLIPGESFEKNIEETMNRCQQFTLLVTPRILEKVMAIDGREKDNYVLERELPQARKLETEKGLSIFPVQMEETDPEGLRAIQIHFCVDCQAEDFHDRLLATLPGLAERRRDTPEQDYLIGLAYRDGIDMEVDRERAVALITEAAEAGLEEAQQMLAQMYENGMGVPRDYEQACRWVAARNRAKLAQVKDGLDEAQRRQTQIDAMGKPHMSREELEVSYAHSRALRMFRSILDVKINDWCKLQLELSQLYCQSGNGAAAADTIKQTISFLEDHPAYDETDIYADGVISRPNESFFTTAFFDLQLTLLEYLLAQKQFAPANDRSQMLLQWLQRVESRYGQDNKDVARLRRQIKLQLARMLFCQERFEEVRTLLQGLIDETVQQMRAPANADAFGFGALMDTLFSKNRMFDFLSDTFMLLGDTCRKLEDRKAALDAYDEAVAGDKYSEDRAKLSRQITGLLGMAEMAAALKDRDKAQMLLQQVDDLLDHAGEGTLQITALKRERFAVAGRIDLLCGQPSAAESFEKALQLAGELVQDAANVENLYYEARLWECLHTATKNREVTEQCVARLKALTEANRLNEPTLNAREALAETYLLLYRCSGDRQALTQARDRFRDLAAQYPQVASFARKQKELDSQMQ